MKKKSPSLILLSLFIFVTSFQAQQISTPQQLFSIIKNHYPKDTIIQNIIEQSKINKKYYNYQYYSEIHGCVIRIIIDWIKACQEDILSNIPASQLSYSQMDSIYYLLFTQAKSDPSSVNKIWTQYALPKALSKVFRRDSIIFNKDRNNISTHKLQGQFTLYQVNGDTSYIYITDSLLIQTYDDQQYNYTINYTGINRFLLTLLRPNSDQNNQNLSNSVYTFNDENLFYLITKTSDTTYRRSKLITYTDSYKDFQQFRNKLNSDYSDSLKSPLKPEQILQFKALGGHKFFEFKPSLAIQADFVKYDSVQIVGFETSTDRIAQYRIYGKATFPMNNSKITLTIYQSQQAIKMDAYKDHLFLPFTDLTTGEETYGGGRYIDLRIPENSNKIIIDFNKSYQPYCAYTTGYSCPIPPKENFIDFDIRAGIKHLELDQ